MNARWQHLWSNLTAVLAAQPPARRVAIVATGVGSMALVLGLAWWVQRPLYRPLFANLAAEDAAAIVEALRTEKVDYRLEDGGHAVLVPAERLYELRLSLASRGLPEGGGVGFEIFDRQSLGQTDFVQHLNYQRALQGELGRTIAQLGGVEAARVHLAIPERSLFVAQQRQPSASVVVRLARGRTLSGTQLDGIVHLVAASVQGLAPDAVTVVDEDGRMLTPDHRGEAGAPGGALEYQRGLERSAEERIETMLGTVVGPGKVIARVAATVDFTRTERTEETFDPDRTVVRQNHTTREETIDPKAAAPSGAPASPADRSRPRTGRQEETQSYEISKTVSRTVAPVGTVRQLSVAVLIDGSYRDEQGVRTFVPRPEEELEKLKGLVESAVGYSETRGDRIEITSAPFQTAPVEEGGGVLAVATQWGPAILVRLLGIGLILAVLAWIVRPLAQALLAPRRQAGIPNVFVDRETAAGDLARENVALTQQNPERAAQLVRQWLLDSTQRSA